MISDGQFEAARTALETENTSQADILFFEALVLKAQGRHVEAIQGFRRVLQVTPNHINARRELAHTLLLNRDYGPSKYHFEALLQVDPNEQMRDAYRHFVNVIHQNQPIGFGGSFSILPSTNVNRGTTNTVFDTTLGQFVIDPSSQANSGVGTQVGFSGYFRHLNNPTNRLALTWGVSGTRYEAKQYNSATANVALSYEKITSFGSWSFSPYYRAVWREDDADYDARGLRFGLAYRLNDTTQLGFTLAHEYQNFTEHNYRDGAVSYASINLSYQLSPSMSISGGMGVEKSSPDAEHLQYESYEVLAGVARSWEGGLQTNLSVNYAQKDFSGVYPLTNFTRSDESYTISFGVQHSRVNIYGFTPHLSCSHTLNKSNIAFGDYTATECRASISRNF